MIMCNNIFEDSNWFYIKNGRAMVSLGPLHEKKTCPYRCAFCYVQDGFSTYKVKSINDIISFLLRHRSEYNIIYVSGDTDSFAEPRQKTGISLLKNIAQKIDCDLLFTTRTIFTDQAFPELSKVVQMLSAKGKKLFACVSITRYSEKLQYLEPAPIPSPDERIHMLKKLHEIGAVSVLALRPFLPVVDMEDYITILEKSKKYVDIVLGETFYFVRNGNIERRVFIDGIPENIALKLKPGTMYFNNNDKQWVVWCSEDLETHIKIFCKNNNMIFSMHSEEAIDIYKKQCDLMCKN